MILATYDCDFFYICRLTYVRSCSSWIAKNEGQEFTFFANGLLGANNPPLCKFLSFTGRNYFWRFILIFFMIKSCYGHVVTECVCPECCPNTQIFSCNRLPILAQMLYHSPWVKIWKLKKHQIKVQVNENRKFGKRCMLLQK